ncbi:MAG: AsmA-like C-terminal region-containing protein [Parvibaculum sp.]|uniref:YhdP family protein n=1 Tax=Parvibaculum sp. TaxID=2024848 RepID=UPI003C77FD7F
MIRRTSKIALEIVGVAVAATAILLAVLAWRLSSGPVSLPILAQILQDGVTGQLNGGSVEIGGTILRWRPEQHQVGLRVVDVKITGADGNRVAVLPEVSFRLSMPALLRGRIAPTAVELYGVSATLIRRPEGLSMGLASANDKSRTESSFVLGPMVEALVRGESDSSMLGYLRRVGIQDATLRIVDEVNGVTFEAPKANLAIFRGDGGLAATLSADLALGDTMGHIELEGALPEGAKSATVAMHATNIVPAALARMSPAFANYAMIDAPMDAAGDLDIAPDGEVKSAHLVLDAGKGNFTIPGLKQAPVPLEKAHAELSLDAPAKRIALHQLVLQAGPHRVAMTGHVDYVLGEGVDLTSAKFELSAGKTTTQMAGIFEGLVNIDNAHLAGMLDFDKRALIIDDVSIGVAGGKVAASGTIGEGARSPALKIKGTIDNIPVNEARSVWPLALSPNSREWVSKNMKDGTLEKGTFAIDVPVDLLADADENHTPIPNERIQFEFNVRGTTVNFLDGMPPLSGVAARGLVQGNRFDAWVTSASVVVAPGKVITIPSGHFLDGSLADKTSIGEIEFAGAGATADILALLDHEPLKLIRGFGLDPSTIGGSGTLNATLRLPLVKTVTIDEVDFAGKAHAENVVIPNIQPDLSITSGTLDIDVSRKGLKGVGNVSLNGIPPLKLVWTESFVRTKAPSSSYQISGRLDDAARKAIGLVFDKYITGPAMLDATLTGSGANIGNATVHADVTGAALDINYLGWTKPTGKTAAIDFNLAMSAKGFAFSGFKLSGEGIDARGDFVMDKNWDWISAALPVVKLGPHNDLSMNAQRDDKGELTLDIKGVKADARGLLHSFVSGNGDKKEAEAAATRIVTPAMESDPARRTVIRAALGEVAAQNDTKFTGLDASLTLIDDWVYLVRIEGTDESGMPFKASIKPAENRTRDFSMTSNDAGFVFRSLDLAKEVVGGAFVAKAGIDDKLPGSPMDGTIDVAQFRIANAPVLAKILTLGSLTGIGDTLKGEGIYFDSLKLPFRVTGHRIHVDDARMAGPAIGLTMKGQVDRAFDVVDMEGTLVPAYTINSILGNVPLLGPLIISRKGEGIFGFTYAVKGSTDNPSVIVNPLSAIAPGFLRRLFEFGSSLPPEPVAPVTVEPAETSLPPQKVPESAESQPQP